MDSVDMNVYMECAADLMVRSIALALSNTSQHFDLATIVGNANEIQAELTSAQALVVRAAVIMRNVPAMDIDEDELDEWLKDALSSGIVVAPPKLKVTPWLDADNPG